VPLQSRKEVQEQKELGKIVSEFQSRRKKVLRHRKNGENNKNGSPALRGGERFCEGNMGKVLRREQGKTVSAGNKEKTFSVGKTGLNISVGARRAVPLLGNNHN